MQQPTNGNREITASRGSIEYNYLVDRSPV